MTTNIRTRVVIVAVLAASLIPSLAAAQACCSATSAGEAGVVGRCHYAVVSTSVGLEHGVGYTDRDGEFLAYDSTQSTDAIVTVSGGLRPFDRRFRVGAVVPLRIQHRSAADLSSTEARLGDVSLNAAFFVLQDPMTGLDSPLPFLEPFVAGTLPTGVGPAESSDPLSADTTSPGGGSIAAGLNIIKFVTPANAVRLSGQYRYEFSHRMPTTNGDVSVRPGPAVELGLGWAYEGSIFWSFGAFTRLTLQQDLTEDGTPVIDSDVRRLYTGLYYRHSLDFPWWDLTASIGQDMLGGRNLARAGVTFSLGLRRNFF